MHQPTLTSYSVSREPLSLAAGILGLSAFGSLFALGAIRLGAWLSVLLARLLEVTEHLHENHGPGF